MLKIFNKYLKVKNKLKKRKVLHCKIGQNPHRLVLLVSTLPQYHKGLNEYYTN